MANPKFFRRFVVAPLLLAAAVPLVAQPVDGNWDGLLEVKAKKMDKVYLLPNADFRTYTKVMIDPTEVSFKKNWQRDQNRDRLDLSNRVSDADARRILDEAQKGFDKYFAEAYTKAGFQVVQAPGPDVLHLSTAIINLDVTAPDVSTSARSRSFSRDAGEATLVLEVKDSVSGQVLGRAVDRQDTSDMGPYIRNSVTNAAAFEEVFKKWAERSAEGLTDLKELSPVNPSTLQAGS
ncbi:DUF3313 family protein [Croceibacterium sp. LX-88]|jgi:hypothetical protein|uniref:DUF3313 family protein n=1 Tax=Croceibacterium selenioxidans TaxID=2838833 RepID=A0ABS5W7B3_9SPHN|nr:DUF3313 family protein [Croceibacterium selenioxidans]MBT2135650.1 DUF3313 family protein [Croceibacterium selenioxidans]